jgi:hypothetical protein
MLEVPQPVSVVYRKLFGRPDPRGTQMRRELRRVERATGMQLIIQRGGERNGARYFVLESLARSVLSDQLAPTPSEDEARLRELFDRWLDERERLSAERWTSRLEGLSARVDALENEVSRLSERLEKHETRRRRIAVSKGVSAQECANAEQLARRDILVDPRREVPPYVAASEVAIACKISRKRATNLLKSCGILEKIGKRWYVGEARLRERLPDVYTKVFAAFVMNHVFRRP